MCQLRQLIQLMQSARFLLLLKLVHLLLLNIKHVGTFNLLIQHCSVMDKYDILLNNLSRFYGPSQLIDSTMQVFMMQVSISYYQIIIVAASNYAALL